MFRKVQIRAFVSAKRSGGAKSNGRGYGKLAKMSKSELYEQAQKLDIPGRSGMSREELVEAIGNER